MEENEEKQMEEFAEFLGKGFAVLWIIVCMVLLMTLPTYWLWNWLMPTIFGLNTITLWQALGLNILCSILFKSTNVSNN
jgi:hypothetical protein